MTATVALPASARRSAMRDPLMLFGAPAALLALWFVASAAGWTNPYLLPSPGEVWDAAVDLWRRGLLGRHVAASMARVLAGFALTVAIAGPLAVAVHLSRRLDDATSLVFDALRVTPPLALVPLLILWLGIGEASKLAVIVLAAFFPLYMSVLTGLRQTDHRLVEMAATLALTRGETIRHVLVPSALPGIVTGLRLGFGFSWRALIGAELIAASSGLGYLIVDAGEMARTDRVFVGLLAIAVLGAAIDALFLALARRLTNWERRPAALALG